MLLGAVFAAALLLPTAALAQAATEYEVKAAFLYNFARFVEWPAEAFASPDDPIVLAIAGDDPFDGLLERTVRGQTAQRRHFVVRRFHKPSEIDFCHILFIVAAEDQTAWLQALERSQSGGALTVGEGRDFSRHGAVAFLIDQRRIQLAINLDSLAAARLRVSSRLLALARVVTGRAQAGGEPR